MRFRGWERMNHIERKAFFVACGALLLEFLLPLFVFIIPVPGAGKLAGLLFAVFLGAMAVMSYRRKKYEGILYGIGAIAMLIVWIM